MFIDAPLDALPVDIEITVASPAEADLWVRTTAQGFEDTDVTHERRVKSDSCVGSCCH
jgi:hypothetical protein